MLGLVLAGAAVAIYKDRHAFLSSLDRLGAGTVLGSFGAGLVAVSLTFPVWLNVLRGVGALLPPRLAARVYFTSQVGKYLPGSVWPVAMQMEAGRARGASRRTMLAANLVSITLACSVGLIVASVLLPFYDADALARYWWSLLALPVLLALLHPRALPGILDWLFSLARRQPLRERLDAGAELRAALWSLASWLAYGVQVGILTLAVGHGVVSPLVLSTGAMALAMPLGILFLPAPAGAGVRDVVLALVLSSALSRGQLLAVIVASRVILVACDVFLALASMLLLSGPLLLLAEGTTRSARGKRL